MDDQAHDLRRLVRHYGQADAPDAPGPALVVLSGGKGGVGTTTLAVNLAVAAAQAGGRPLLIDAGPHGSNAAILCGLEERYTLADVLAGRRELRDVLQAGPAGLRVAPGAWGPERLGDDPPSAPERLLDQLQELDGEADLAVLDAGNSPSRMVRRLWQSADLVLVVTSPETASLLETYTAIKVLGGTEGHSPPFSLVSRTLDAQMAQNVHRRLAQACHRFLGVRLDLGGWVPDDPEVSAAGRAGIPFVLAAPDGDAARQVRALSAWVAAYLSPDSNRRGAPDPTATEWLGQETGHHSSPV
jgi:flagellar biosynthesis protein FlhG